MDRQSERDASSKQKSYSSSKEPISHNGEVEQQSFPRKPTSKAENSFTSSFRCAWDGIVYALKTQRNPRIHGLFALAAIILGVLFSLSLFEWLAIVMCITLVFSLELLNTAVEQAVDLSSPRWHQLAMWAKDCAAGAVLVGAFGSLVVAAIIFLPRIFAFLLG